MAICLKNDVIETLHYFAFFSYAPTGEEIYLFLKRKTTPAQLLKDLEEMEKNKCIYKVRMGNPGKNNGKRGIYQRDLVHRYTLGEYSISALEMQKKIQISHTKYQKIQRYIRVLKYIPQIKLVGLSGSVAMANAQEKDDVDIFIITAFQRLWTGRFIAVVLAKLFGVHRSYSTSNTKDKVCLNLFFDEGDLTLPLEKQTEYGAHEVLQMKPLIQKEDIYQRLLGANAWAFKIFPNSKLKVKSQESKVQVKNKNFLWYVTRYILHVTNNTIESLLKSLQLQRIQRHRTTELIRPTQLWFHPQDFQKKIHH